MVIYPTLYAPEAVTELQVLLCVNLLCNQMTDIRNVQLADKWKRQSHKDCSMQNILEVHIKMN